MDKMKHIYTDGYLSQMYGPEATMTYLARLLQVDPRTLSFQVITNQEWPSTMFFICSPEVPHARPFTTIHGHPAWLLDFAIRSVGTVVRQRIWEYQTAPQHYAPVALKLPIFFALNDGVTLGLPIVTAAAGDHLHMTLRGSRTPALVGECSTAFIRINVSADFPCLPCDACARYGISPPRESLTVLM